MNFRLADNNDLETLIQVRLDFFREMFPPQSPENLIRLTDALRQYYQKHLWVDFWAVLAEDGVRSAGTAILCLSVCPPNPDMPDGRTGEVYNVLIYPQYRGRGLAAEMVGCLISTAAEAGLSRLILSASEAGRPVYEKLGFVEQSGHTGCTSNLTPKSRNAKIPFLSDFKSQR